MLYLVSFIFVQDVDFCHLQTKQNFKQHSFYSSFNTMLKPISLNCGHSGCQTCFGDMNANLRSSTIKCPICRTLCNVQTLNVNVALDNLTQDLAVECQNLGCDWKGRYGDAQKHFKECPKLESQCENEGCEHMLAREHMADHAESCAKRKVRCPDCSKSVISDRLSQHRSSRCDHASTQCPLSCRTSLPR